MGEEASKLATGWGSGRTVVMRSSGGWQWLRVEENLSRISRTETRTALLHSVSAKHRQDLWDLGEYVDLVKAGIIDPVKVMRTALLDAASVSVLLTTTEVAVVDLEEEKANPGASRMPQMEDMDL
ncbi:Chaperonin CPN60, mitochondrial [Dendrobium catenatum]|uniref:Chaperonin CPN60, mitochondrial n=1 Tax=Dendrobium catenatum TaxID=906689 RepID=A0A2I0V9X1_9ASPA|nr:Chaperonin CPN60, mitochondrial [Dendrobium catenatum]